VSTIQNEYFNRFDHEIQVRTKHALSAILAIVERKKSYSNASAGKESGQAVAVFSSN